MIIPESLVLDAIVYAWNMEQYYFMYSRTGP